MKRLLAGSILMTALYGAESAAAQGLVPPVPPNRLYAGFSLDRPTLADLVSESQEWVTAEVRATMTGEILLGYERDLGNRTIVGFSAQLMSVPMAVDYDRYELADTTGGLVGPIGRGAMRLGDWSKFGLQCDFQYRLRSWRSAELRSMLGVRLVVSPGSRFSYRSGYDFLYETRLIALRIVGRYQEPVTAGPVGGIRFSTRSRNDNGVHITLLGAWFMGNGFAGTLYTLPDTPMERRARFSQGHSFVGLSIALYKSWGPPKVPMRLRNDREP